MAQDLTGFNSLGITVDYESDTFKVFEETFGSYALKVADTSKPLWYGNYNAGKLAIYLADKTPIEPTSIPCYAIIFVIAEQLDPKMNCMGCVLVDVKISQVTAIGKLLEHVKTKLLEVAMDDKNEMVAHGYAHIH